MVNLDFDEASWALINHISNSVEQWDSLMYDKTAEELAEVAKEYMKPLMHVRPLITNSAEDNLRHEVQSTGTGFEISFFSNFYINFVDAGSPFGKLYAYDYGLRAFPIDKRFGTTMPRASISGVGQGNSPYASQLPTHFSEQTVEYLVQDKAAEIALQNMIRWINWAVSME